VSTFCVTACIVDAATNGAASAPSAAIAPSVRFAPDRVLALGELPTNSQESAT